LHSPRLLIKPTVTRASSAARSKGDYGQRKRNATATIMYAGNALQVFAELQSAHVVNPGPWTGCKT
jgi:hypothetical protein